MNTTPNPRRKQAGLIGPIFGLLILIIGIVICWKIYKLAERLCPLPPPPPACPDTNTPGTNTGIVSVDAAWFILYGETNVPNVDPFDVMYGVMPDDTATGFAASGIPVMAGGGFESAGGATLDTSNVLAQIRAWYGVGPDQYHPNNAAHSQWTQDEAGNWSWVSTPATNLSYDGYSGVITVQEWTRTDAPRPVVLQRSEDNVTWTNIWTNTLRSGQFRLYRDTAPSTNSGFYRTVVAQ